MLMLFDGKRLMIPIALFLAAAVMSAISSAGAYVLALDTLMAPTAAAGFILFWFVFTASSLARVAPTPTTRFLVRNRRYIGLSFAMVMGAHLVFVLSNLMMTNDTKPLAFLIGGGVAYSFLGLMVLTSNNAAVRALGAKRWKRLHKTGSYVLWAVFLTVAAFAPVDRAWMLLLCAAALALRISAYRMGRKTKAERQPPSLH
ncbi:hypothetical protein [Kordiimonas marina]|uniref:hypothetical protein n=1 Tax=Kordiimonas marina TaxID=2872312 RepID=UPI001FF5CBF3|nr:hypothetical protein [Kordiimonas marina]MCJ9428528.1 hypothetical protein [Kordiimonas marina]